jgi:hypothetical protein
MNIEVAIHSNIVSMHPHKVIPIKRLVCVQYNAYIHDTRCRQGSSINNIANQDHFIIGHDEPHIHDLPTSREALLHSMLNKEPPFIVQCTYHRWIEVSKKHPFHAIVPLTSR